MNTNKVENNKKSKLLKLAILLVLVVAIISAIGFAYARYITRLNGSTQAPIASWNFSVTAGSSQSLDIDLSETREVNDNTEVDGTKVAPGTKGAFVLNVNATGSQVSLEYDIDISLTRIPENLIFYSDSNRSNAIYKENGTIHFDGYFGQDTVNKTESRTIYWEWPMETGTTQNEINDNDLLDSEWIGDSIVLGIKATGRQVVENNATQYAVTFNANGGTLQEYGNSSVATKYVASGEQYGNLPTPTRAGYTFIGWSTDGSVSVVEDLISDIGSTKNVRKISENNWYIDYIASTIDTYIVFQTLTGYEVVDGEYYTLLFNVSGLTDESNVEFGFPNSWINLLKLKNGINKIKFNHGRLSNFNSYVFDDKTADATQQFYVSDFILYKNYGDEYTEAELSNLTPQSNMTFYALWKEN